MLMVSVVPRKAGIKIPVLKPRLNVVLPLLQIVPPVSARRRLVLVTVPEIKAVLISCLCFVNKTPLRFELFGFCETVQGRRGFLYVKNAPVRKRI